MKLPLGKPVLLTIAGLLVVILVGVTLSRRAKTNEAPAPIAFTVGDVQAVHAEVKVSGREVRGTSRLSDGDALETGPDGRARLMLDDGALVVVDRSTKLALREQSLSLEKGRIFVEGGPMSRTVVVLGGTKTGVSSSAAAFERRDAAGAAGGKIYCAQGELVLDAGGRSVRVASGETATLGSGGPTVEPEKAFDDWTGGLAVPWAGETGQKSAIPELWGVQAADDPGSPFAVRSQKIDVRIDGEVAVTRTRTTFFNGSESEARPEVRMAVPPGAILSRVAAGRGPSAPDQEANVRAVRFEEDRSLSGGRLEWAGGGSLRGDLPTVSAGSTVELAIDYVEWLPIRGGRATYRFPMAQPGEPPLVSELSAHVNAERAGSPWISASAGTAVKKSTVELRRADARPTGDLVVELAPKIVSPEAARAYVEQAPKGEDPFVLVRSEVPEKTETGVTLAVVVDSSMSVGASLETERAVVDAILEGLGPRDALVVLAADQTVRYLGPAVPKPVTPETRTEIRKALSALRAGGASNLGLALERAADALDGQTGGKRSGSGMVVYVGDGRPTVGDIEPLDLRRRLGRRAGGVPRLGAIATGAGAQRWLLARLVLGSGPVYEVTDSADAARVGALLLADALEPTLLDVELDLGPTIDRIYPREARAALAGSTLTVVGRLRGKLPARIGFRFRDGGKVVEQSRPLTRVAVPADADVARRWAAARIEEMVARGDGLEPAIALAVQAKLLTPWTSWFFGSGSNPQASAPFAWRVLGLAPALDAAFAGRIDPTLGGGSTLLEPPKAFGGGVTLTEACALSARRTIDEAGSSIRACRDARAAVRPEVMGALVIALSVNPEGRAMEVSVSAADPRNEDPVLDRCVKGVVESIPFFASGLVVRVSHRLTVPEGQGSRRTRCSATSKLPLTIRRGIWRARSGSGVERYLGAARGCELPKWTDRRELLLLLLERESTSEQQIALARALEAVGEADASAFVQKEALRRVTSVSSLEAAQRALLANEPAIDGELDKAYRAATGDEKRLEVVRRFLRLAPHSPLARRRLFALLEALGRTDALVQEVGRARSDPFADAGLLAAGASALRRVGLDDDGRRAFGELVERAPRDPWTLAYVGDRLRAEGLFDESVATYEALGRALPDEAAVALRLGLAHAGAGRLDVATRLFDRVTQTGGRGDDGRLGELASITEAVLLAEARAQKTSPDVDAQLVRRLVQTPLPDVASLVVVRTPPADAPIEVRVAREERGKEEEPADFAAPSMGLSAVRIERGDGTARILLRRPAEPGPSRTARATVAVLVLADDRALSRLVTREVEVGASGEPVELRWNGESFL